MLRGLTKMIYSVLPHGLHDTQPTFIPQQDHPTRQHLITYQDAHYCQSATFKTFGLLEEEIRLLANRSAIYVQNAHSLTGQSVHKV